MLTPERLGAYFEQQLPPAERREIDQALAESPEARRQLADQARLDGALRALLGSRQAEARIRSSIFAVLRGASEQELAAGILAETATQPRKQRSFLTTWRLRFAGMRSWPRWAWAAALATILGLGLLVQQLFLRPPPRIEVGRLSVVIGAPTHGSETPRRASTAQEGAALHLGDRLETGDADRAEIRFHDGTTLRLAFNTTVEFPRTTQDPRPATNALLRPSEIRLLQGHVWTQVQKLTNALPYAIRTDAATAIARGTEFGVKLQRIDTTATNSPFAIRDSRFAAVLSVKEGIVDFTNALGSVRATAMMESTATANSAPTEPRRVDTLQTVSLADGATWALVTSPLDWPAAAAKLVGGGGTLGWHLLDRPGPNGANEVLLSQVSASSPAARAGLRVGDTIVSLAGQPLTNAQDLARAVVLNPGRALELRVRRPTGDEPVTLTIAAGTNLLRGPNLSTRQQLTLMDRLRMWLEEPRRSTLDHAAESRRLDQAASVSSIPSVRAAAFNQLGVADELADALGPAIRAYGRAAYLQPDIPLYRFNLALALRQIGSLERAHEELRETLRLEPESAPARKRLAEVVSLLGRHDEALSLVRELLKIAPDDHGAWELQAQLLLKSGRPADAMAPARRAVELQPGCAVAHAYLAEALHASHHLPEASAAWTQAIQLAPFEAVFHANFGMLHRDLLRTADAEASLRRAIELRPDFGLAHRNLGEVLIDRGEYDRAFAAFATAQAVEPTDPTAWVREGDLALGRRQFARAERAYRAAIEIAPHQADAWHGLGEACRFLRRPAEAERAYHKAIEVQPRHAAAHTGLGILSYDRGEATDAERFYRRALELAPDQAAPYHNLGNLYREARGDLDAAERWFRQALERAPDDGESLGGLGLVALDRHNLPEAERYLRRAVERVPGSSVLQNNLGEVLRNRGRTNEAEAQYRKALELDPDHPSPHGNLGILHAERKQFPEAEKAFRSLLQRSTGNARLPALVNLATVCGEQSKLEEAEGLFRQALALAPNHPRVAASFASFLADHRTKLDEALKLAEGALRTVPEKPEFLDALGWVQARRGDLQTAERTLRRALELAGESIVASEIREHLRRAREDNRPVGAPPISKTP